MDTKHFDYNPFAASSSTGLTGQLVSIQQRSELHRLHEENTQLRHQINQLQNRLADLREMVHDFLTASDPA